MSQFVTEAFTLLAFGLVIIGARTYARWTQVGVRGFEADDYGMILAAVSTYLAPHMRTGRIFGCGTWRLTFVSNGRLYIPPRQHSPTAWDRFGRESPTME